MNWRELLSMRKDRKDSKQIRKEAQDIQDETDLIMEQNFQIKDLLRIKLEELNATLDNLGGTIRDSTDAQRK